ncbi:MAG: hypothetical protein ACFCVC_02170 [Acidimicrobiia bacterium]
MTPIIVILWLVLTRMGSSRVVWPGSPRSDRPTEDRVPLDRTAVMLEAVVAAVVVAAVPFTFLSEAFTPLERIGLVALAPFIARLALDRIAKLAAGWLMRVDCDDLVMAGLPARRVSCSAVTQVRLRRVTFGPDDLVLRGGRVPIVIDTQFTTLDDDALQDWVIGRMPEH